MHKSNHHTHKSNHHTHKSYNHVINQLQDYMMTGKLYLKYNNTSKKESKSSNKSNKSNKSMNLITIKDQDQLFWYYYIAMNSYDDYKYLDHKFTKEKELKIQNIETMKNNNSILKQNKIKISDYETDLLNSKQISLSTLRGLCAYNEVNIIYIKDKIYYDFRFNDTQVPIIIYKQGKTYSCNISPSLETIEMIKQKYYYIDNPSKPINGISSYKIKELSEICKKLDINTRLESGKPKNKKILYEEIKAYL